MLGNMLNDLAEAIRRWMEKKYERLSKTLLKDKVYADLGTVTSYTGDSGGPSAMEVNQISKSKGKSKMQRANRDRKAKERTKGNPIAATTRTKASHSRAAKSMQIQPPKVEERIS